MARRKTSNLSKYFHIQGAISLEQAEQFMRDKDIAFMFETSAKTSENV